MSVTFHMVVVYYNDRVVKGQTLAIIDTELLDETINQSRATLAARQADINQARATLADAEAQLNRFQQVYKLSGGKVPAKTEMETAIANRDRAAAAGNTPHTPSLGAQARRRRSRPPKPMRSPRRPTFPRTRRAATRP